MEDAEKRRLKKPKPFPSTIPAHTHGEDDDEPKAHGRVGHTFRPSSLLWLYILAPEPFSISVGPLGRCDDAAADRTGGVISCLPRTRTTLPLFHRERQRAEAQAALNSAAVLCCSVLGGMVETHTYTQLYAHLTVCVR